jgi:hypothetical protein
MLTRYGHVIDNSRWQAKEQEADADIAAGRGVFFGSDEEFIGHLKSVPPAEPE